MKRSLVGVFLVLLLAVAAWMFLRLNAVKTSFVNGLPEYSALPGQEYILESDCYIFEFRHARTDWPLMGSHLTVPSLPARVDAREIGSGGPDVRILAVALTGSHFKIVSVRRDQRAHATRLTFEVLFTDEDARPYPRVDVYWMMDHSGEGAGIAPSILGEYAAKRVKF